MNVNLIFFKKKQINNPNNVNYNTTQHNEVDKTILQNLRNTNGFDNTIHYNKVENKNIQTQLKEIEDLKYRYQNVEKKTGNMLEAHHSIYLEDEQVKTRLMIQLSMKESLIRELKNEIEILKNGKLQSILQFGKNKKRNGSNLMAIIIINFAVWKKQKTKWK